MLRQGTLNFPCGFPAPHPSSLHWSSSRVNGVIRWVPPLSFPRNSSRCRACWGLQRGVRLSLGTRWIRWSIEPCLEVGRRWRTRSQICCFPVASPLIAEALLPAGVSQSGKERRRASKQDRLFPIPSYFTKRCFVTINSRLSILFRVRQNTWELEQGKNCNPISSLQPRRRQKVHAGGSGYLVHCITVMALWNGLGQAATIAQLAGMDAAGLISMIVLAVQTVQENKLQCQLLSNHVVMINDLLQLIQQSETMRRPEIRRPLDGLEDTLRLAYMLVTSCQKKNIIYRFIMAGNQARQFRDVRDRIDAYLRIYPMISHIETRYFITELYSRTHPSGDEAQTSKEMLGSITGHSNPDFRTQGSSSSDNGVESVDVQRGTEPLAVEVQQNDGYGNAVVLPNSKHRFRWLFQWARSETSTTRSIDSIIGHVGTGYFTVFKFSQLVASTNNFSPANRIGNGGFGMVFKGVLPNGLDVAIKISTSKIDRSLPQFQQEVLIIPKLHHANIVKLLGCCIEEDNRILIYEYIHNGSLHDILNELRAGVSLSWPIRYRIIEGILQGAAYLNHHCRPRVVHRDLTPQNILLNCDMTPRIADFGLAVVFNSDEDEKEQDIVAGTLGYIAPEYHCTRVLSFKSDVYAVGVILLEIISAQSLYDCLYESGLTSYAWDVWSSGRALELIDPSLHEEPQISGIVRCIQIALLCVQLKPEDRPTMSDVLLMLKCESMTLPIPKRASPMPVKPVQSEEGGLMTEEILMGR